MTFLLQYCLFNESFLGHASWHTFLKYYFLSIVGVVVEPFVFFVLRIQSLVSTCF